MIDSLIVMQFGVPVALIVGLLLAVEGGFRLGERRVRGSDAGKAMETGAIQGAMLGLLGLLLGFSFAGASARYIGRQDLLTREANAIGTAHLRADLLDEPHATALRSSLEDYVDHRVEASRTLQRGLSEEVMRQVSQLHDRIWAAATEAAGAAPSLAMLIIPPVNEVIDLHTTRAAEGRRHLPSPVMALLIVCSVLTLGVIGYACALARRRNTLMTSVIAVLIAAALWITIDLDYPRIGLIQISDRPIIELQAGMQRR